MLGQTLLAVENLTMNYTTRSGAVNAINNISFSLQEGDSLGLVGESGCGKTSLALTLLRLLPDNAVIESGRIMLFDTDLLTLSDEETRKVRWKRISMVFQATMNSLNPVYKVGDQIVKAIETHLSDVSPDQAHQQVKELFDLVGLDPEPSSRYPHEYSGEMRQRAVIAMALSCHPDLIVADEPTTALDVIVQNRVLRKLEEIQGDLGMSMIYISHDIAVIAEVSSRIGVMYAGNLVEMAPTEELLANPLHPYTKALLAATPVPDPRQGRDTIEIKGGVSLPINPDPRCRFYQRCPIADNYCRDSEHPPLEDKGAGHLVACYKV